jgi:two-component system OmpR family sensor kinase/two-component system sensor histidine kinase BaeS
MRFNPSLTSRLRIGFVVLFALLLAVSLLGVGRLFQIRVNYEDDTSRFFQLELETEQLRSSFILEQASVRPPLGGETPSATEFTQAAASFAEAASRAGDLTGSDTVLASRLERLSASEESWRMAVADPMLRGKDPGGNVERRLTSAVTDSGEALAVSTRNAREGARTDARRETRNTTILVAAGLAGALLAALILFSGLINSMRAPLARLVEGARRLAAGDLETRVEAGGPVEIATLGKAFNEMATALERDARERDRVERMKDDFVLTVSHELRTPVTVVKGFSEMLTAQPRSLNSRQLEAAEVIADSAGQLQTMISDLLDLARSDAGKLRIDPEPTPVRSLTQRVGRQMRPNFEEKKQRLTVSIEKDLPEVQADRDRIAQVLANLLTNAYKYAPEGAKVRLTASKVGEEVEFAVSDNGPGLGQEELDHVFDRFWRAQSGETQAVGGTGLGLAIAKSLIELHGGAISATSIPGKGATFRFVLPVANHARPTPGGEPMKAEAKPRAKASR